MRIASRPRPAHLLARLALPACAAALLSAGCGGDDVPAGTGGSGPGPEPLDCAVTTQDGAPIELGEGARSKVVLAFGADVESVLVATTPELKARLEPSGNEIVLEAAYGTRGQTLPIPIEVSCGGKMAPVDMSATVRGIDFAALPDWSSASGPPGREYGTMWIDSGDPDRLLVFGGFHYEPEQFTPAWDLWQYDLAGDTWTELQPKTEPPHLPGGRMIDIPGERAAYYYGGLDTTAPGGGAAPYSMVRFDYAPEALEFSDVPVTTAKTAGDYLPAIVWDAPRNRYVTACGVNEKQGYHCKVHAFDPATGVWTPLAPAGDEKPKGRNGFFWVHDVENDRLVMFSGEMGSGGWECNCAEDTWALELAEEPVRWVKLAGPQTPALGRRNGAYAYDPVGHRMFVWGGTPDGQNTYPGLYAFDLDRGEEGWAKVETVLVPPERTSGMAVYDAARRRMLFGFGNGDGGVHADLWALDL